MAGKDSNNMLGVLNVFYRQCEQAMALGTDITFDQPVNSILFCGMGGSALPGDILQCYLADSMIPLHIIRDYAVPGWVNKNTAVFIISYSGNTEETISMYKKAKAKQCKIVAISAGGDLKELAKNDEVPHIEVPKGINPRDAIGYLTIPIITILQNSGIAPPTKDLPNMIRMLKQDHQQKAKEIAAKLANKIPIIYSSKHLFCVARIWKIKINENAKTPAFWNEFPELNHNEMNGFINPKGDYFVVFISDQDDHPRIKKRMEITRKLLTDKKIPTLELRLTGENRLARIFSAILLGSYVSYYLALSYNIDPNPVEMVEELKARLRG